MQTKSRNSETIETEILQVSKPVFNTFAFQLLVIQFGRFGSAGGKTFTQQRKVCFISIITIN